jgi:hypothetical protein
MPQPSLHPTSPRSSLNIHFLFVLVNFLASTGSGSAADQLATAKGSTLARRSDDNVVCAVTLGVGIGCDCDHY